MSLRGFITGAGCGDIQRIDFNEIFGNDNATAQDIAAARELLARIHGGLYCRTFPIASEREELTEWFDRLSDGESNQSIQFFSVYGKNLEDAERAEIIGLIVSEYFKGQGCGIICYVIREKSYEDILPAKIMCDRHEILMREVCRRVDGHPLKAIFWEANDYRALMIKAIEKSDMMGSAAKNICMNYIKSAFDAGEELSLKDIADFENTYFILHGKEYWRNLDCMDPRKRARHIEKVYGARRLGFYYVQSPLGWYDTVEEREAMSSDCMNLYIYNADAYPDFGIQDIRSYIRFFATVFSRAESSEALGLAAVDKMVAQIDTMEDCNISIWADEQREGDRALLYGEPLHAEYGYQPVQAVQRSA